jgi:hypothetical protein
MINYYLKLKNMKKTLFALLLSFSVSIGYGQVTFYSENMGNVTAKTQIVSHTFQNSSPILYSTNTTTNQSDIRATSSFSGATNDANVFITNTINTFFQIEGINTLNYTNISMELNHYKSTSASNNELVISVSSDGISWTPLSYSRATGSGTSIWITLNPSGSIPSCSNLRINFNNTSSTPQFRIDNIKLKGTAISLLPVELSNFMGEENYLLWTTQSETQNKGWEVERSSDAKTWAKIGFVEGIGNSAGTLHYDFELKEFGKYYYRLKQIDFDGHFQYSYIEFLDNSDIQRESKMYIDLNGRETTKPKANTMYIIPNGGKIMYIED